MKLDESERGLCAAVEAAFEREQVPWFRELVERPSHTHASDDVEHAAKWVDELAARVGLVRRLVSDPQGRFADHRVFSTAATGEGDKVLALVGHVDTVFPRSMGFLRFEREGDVARGPGVLDMKSGLSVVLFALRALQEQDPPTYARLRLRFVCNSDEEVGSPSSAGLFDALAPVTSAALVFEGGREHDHVITRRKGGGSFTFTVEGQAAHAGNDHEAGVNAIHALALLVPRIEALTDYERGVTINVGLIGGGTAKNTVPDRAHCVVDARFLTVEDSDRVVASLQGLAARPFEDGVSPRLRRANVILSGGVTRPPMEATAASQALRHAYEACADALGLGVGEAPLQGGGSDANLLAARGVPAIDGLGPYGRHFHDPREWSSLSSLRRRTQALACLLARMAKNGKDGT